MNVAVSACLLGEKCRYDGASMPDDAVIAFCERTDVDAVPICPEVLGGLPTPRIPSEIVRVVEEKRGRVTISMKVLAKDGQDNTVAFAAGACQALEIAQEADCRYAILKQKSPSCGCGTVYDGTFSGTLASGNGVAAAMFLANGITVVPSDKPELLSTLVDS